MLVLLVMVLPQLMSWQLMMSMIIRLHVYYITSGFKTSVDLTADCISNIVWSKRHVWGSRAPALCQNALMPCGQSGVSPFAFPH